MHITLRTVLPLPKFSLFITAMNEYIQNELRIGPKVNIEEAAPHCAKLLSWLIECHEEIYMRRDELRLSQTEIRCMFKAMLYLNECHDHFGEEELLRLVQLQPINGIAAVRFYRQNIVERRQGITKLCYNILSTHNGYEHAALIYRMHKPYATVQPEWNVIKELEWTEVDKHIAEVPLEMLVNVSGRQMRYLVRRLFRLPEMPQIEMTLQRAMASSSIELEVWLNLFREPKQSSVYTRCRILRKIICDTLLEGVDPACAHFVHNIFVFLAKDIEDESMLVPRFWYLLIHRPLAKAFIKFFHSYWNCHTPDIDFDEMKMRIGTPLPPVALEEMIYLTHLMLNRKSPCRSKFHYRLSKIRHAKQLYQMLNKVAYVYS